LGAALCSILLSFVRLSALGVSAASLLGYLARQGLLFELASHFRVQYAVLLVLACAMLSLMKSFKFAVLAGLVALTDIVAVAPHVLPNRPAAESITSAPPSIRLLSQNVNTSSDNFAAVLAFIQAEQPDLVLLFEVDHRWIEHMGILNAGFPYSCSSPRTDNFGIALWSKFELRDTRVAPMTEVRVPTIITDVLAPGGSFRLIGTHPLPPVSSRYVTLRNEQLAIIAAEVAAHPGMPTLVAGDLNLTPWSPVFADLLHDGRLRDTSRGFGLQRTWPESNWFMRIPIDHVLVTDGISIVDRRVGPNVSSDHRGIIAELFVQPLW